MLFLIVIVMIAIPFIVSYEVDQWREPLPSEEATQQSALGLKASISLLMILLTAKLFQLSNGVVLRQPILRQNP